MTMKWPTLCTFVGSSWLQVQHNVSCKQQRDRSNEQVWDDTEKDVFKDSGLQENRLQPQLSRV